MSDTPRTDAFRATLHSWTGDEEQCLAFAEGVERELHETKKTLLNREKTLKSETDDCVKALTQRDEWKAIAIEFKAWIADPPEPNCSCHVSAPCGDCTEHGYTRELFARFAELEKTT